MTGMTPPDGSSRALGRDPRLRLLAEESGYEVLGRIGAGGMGIVYRALDADGRDVAIKLLRPEIADDPRARERLAREVAAQQRVRHDNIARILDAELDSSEAFVATEFVPGPTLEDAVRDHGALHPEAVREIGLTLGETLRDIHAAGIVHRDLKPSNVLLRDARETDLVSYDPDGAGLDPVVIDFGIAQAAEESRLTSTGLVMGTAAYLDPEVVATNTTSAASDWWSWAALVAFASTGREPFGSGRADLVFFRAQRGEIDVEGLPTELAAWLRDALRADPAERADPEALLARLEDLDLEAFDDPGETEAFAVGGAVAAGGGDARAADGEAFGDRDGAFGTRDDAVAAGADAPDESSGGAATRALPVAGLAGAPGLAGAAGAAGATGAAAAVGGETAMPDDADRTQALPALGEVTEDLAVQDGATEALPARGATEALPAGGATEALPAGPGATAVLPAGPAASGHDASGQGVPGQESAAHRTRGASTPVDAEPTALPESSEPDTEIMEIVREPTRAIPVIRDDHAAYGHRDQGRSAPGSPTQARPGQGYPAASGHDAGGSAPTQGHPGHQRPSQPQTYPQGYPGSSPAAQQSAAQHPASQQRPTGYPQHPGYGGPQQTRPAMHPQQAAQMQQPRMPQQTPRSQPMAQQQVIQQRPQQGAAPQIYAPYGFGPDGRPLGPPQVVGPPRPPRRPLLALLGHAILIALAAVVPYIALAAMLVLGAVSRTWERSHRSIQAARYRGKASGASWAIGLAVPFRFLLGLLEMALQALFPLLLGLVLAVCADALAHYGAGMLLPSGALFAGTMAVTLLLTWVGLGSRTTRDGAHRMLDSAAPDHLWGGVIAVLLALLLGAVIVTIGARTGQVDYFPFVGGPRLDELLPWRA